MTYVRAEQHYNSLQIRCDQILQEIKRVFPQFGSVLEGTKIVVSRQLTMSAGNANPKEKLIKISGPIFSIGDNLASLRNTVLHEIAHVIAGPNVTKPHGAQWVNLFKRIGGDGLRCHDLKLKGPKVYECAQAFQQRWYDVDKNRNQTRGHPRLLSTSMPFTHSPQIPGVVSSAYLEFKRTCQDLKYSSGRSSRGAQDYRQLHNFSIKSLEASDRVFPQLYHPQQTTLLLLLTFIVPLVTVYSLKKRFRSVKVTKNARLKPVQL